MEFDYLAIPTGKVDEVVISVNEAQPLSTVKPTLDVYWLVIYTLYSMQTLYYLFILSCIVDEKQLMRTSIVSQFAAFSYASLIYARRKYLQSSMNDRFNTMLGIISIFWAVMASTSLMFVFFTSQNLIWIGFIVLIWNVAVGVAYHFKKDVWESEVRKLFQPRHGTNYSVSVTPLLMMLSSFIIPVEFELTRLLIMPVLSEITFVFCCVSAIKGTYARNLEVDSLIQPMIQKDESKIVSVKRFLTRFWS